MSRSARTKLWLLLLMRQQPSTASEVNASEAAQLMGQPSNTSEVNEYYEPEVAQSTSPEVRMLTLGLSMLPVNDLYTFDPSMGTKPYDSFSLLPEGGQQNLPFGGFVVDVLREVMIFDPGISFDILAYNDSYIYEFDLFAKQWIDLGVITGSAYSTPSLATPYVSTSNVLNLSHPSLGDDLRVLSAPFIHTHLTGMVKRTKAGGGALPFMDPLENGVWIAWFMCAIVWGVTVFAVDAIERGTSPRELVKRCMAEGTTFVYHGLVNFFDGETYEGYTTAPMKVLRFGTIFVVLVLTSTYTANLAAFFTRPSFKLHGPEDMSALEESVACVQDDVMQQTVQPYARRVIWPTHLGTQEDTYFDSNYRRQDRTRYCVDQVSSGDADIFVADVEQIKIYFTRRRIAKGLHTPNGCKLCLLPSRSSSASATNGTHGA